MEDDQYEPEELPEEFFEDLAASDRGKDGESSGKRKVKVNFKDARTQYANFFTLTLRSGEIFLGFGQAAPPVKEVKIHNQIVMGARSAERLHAVLGKALRKQRGENDSD